MEHVEVLREMRDIARAAIKAGDWKVDGACDPDAALRRADAAIAALSAPAEAQPVAWEWEYIGVDQYPRGHKVARSLREMDPTNPPYPETWRPTRPLIYGDTAPPSAPVGVEAFTEKHGVDLRGITVGEVLTQDQWDAVCAFVREQDAIIDDRDERLEALAAAAKGAGRQNEDDADEDREPCPGCFVRGCNGECMENL